MDTYPYARTAAEEDYYRAVDYLASALYLFDAGDDALGALRAVWQQVMDRQATCPPVHNLG
jgi:hypothetical protein